MLNNLTKLLGSTSSVGNVPNPFGGLCRGAGVNTQTSAERVYNFNKGNNGVGSPNSAVRPGVGVAHTVREKENATILLKNFFASISCLISKPLFIISPNKVLIQLCFYKPERVQFKGKIDFTSSPASVNNTSTLEGATQSQEGGVSPALQQSLVAGKTNGAAAPVKYYNPDFKYLSFMLSQIFNKEVELELIPLRYPYHDSNILAQLLAKNSNKYNFNRMLQQLFKKANIVTSPSQAKRQSLGAELSPSPLMGGKNINQTSLATHEQAISPALQVTGIKIRIAGRLTTQRIVPKSTVKTAYKGNLSSSLTGKAGQSNLVDSASYTSKNKIGAYTVKVWICNNISN